MVGLFLLVFGLIIGSFLGALTYRYPRGLSVATGRSFCPKCKKQIGWMENVPVASYIILGGKCSGCKKRISLRYPLIEIATGLGFWIIGANVYALTIFCLLIAIFVIDLEHQIIPDIFIFLGIGIAFLNLLLGPNATSLPASLLAGFAAATFLLLIHLATKGRGMGLGDVKFAVLGGLIAGPKLSLIWLFASFLTGAICGIILIFAGRAKMKSKIAFGPFLVVGLLVALSFGDKILNFLGF
jgi:prepilin signal peptidase PulO-like enzyme (type II secretory pathway)